MAHKRLKLLIVSDLHCGHLAGLTHPDYWLPEDCGDPWAASVGKLQRVTWAQWLEISAGRYDVVLCNGDAISGRGEASGGTENVVQDRSRQVDMAEAALRSIKADRFILTYGTPYHVGKEEDWEAVLAKALGAEIHSQVFFRIGGVCFHAKHKTGGSSIPHGRLTPVSRDSLWLRLWEQEGDWPKADVVIRSHIHAYLYGGDSRQLRMITPALQAPRDKFGSRQCTNTVDWGCVVFECGEGAYDYTPRLRRFVETKPEVIEI